MKRVWCTLVVVLLTCCWMILPASAVERTGLPLVVDETGVLSQQELDTLNVKAEEMEEEYHCDVVVAYINTLNGANVMDYADDYFDYNGYGYGSSHDGILLLVAAEEREYWMTCTGKGMEYFDRYTRDNLEYNFQPYLAQGDWYNAAGSFLVGAETVLYQQTQPASVSPVMILVDLALGFLLSWILLGVMEADLHPVTKGVEASQYIAKNGVQMSDSKDIFLRSVRRARPIERESRGGGDSSTHVSSSGTTHTGSGGKF